LFGKPFWQVSCHGGNPGNLFRRVAAPAADRTICPIRSDRSSAISRVGSSIDLWSLDAVALQTLDERAARHAHLLGDARLVPPGLCEQLEDLLALRQLG